MGSEVSDFQDGPLHCSPVKVHFTMCTTLLNLVARVLSIIPDIEASKPQCSSGIEALCLLHKAVEKARTLDQYCRESSKLYLALTGNTVVKRFEKTKSYMEQGLSQLQSMVPVVLQLQIAETLNYLRLAKFFLESHEEEAGNALRALVQQDESLMKFAGNTAIEVLQFAASRLHLTTQKDLLTERRSIRKLLSEVTEENTKRKTLKYFFYLLKKHDKLLVLGQPEKPSIQYDGTGLLANSLSVKSTKSVPQYTEDETQVRMVKSPSPPEELKCPLSSKLMSDPVVICSGQSFERACLQKWFDEGHDTCPKTGLKLDNLSVQPNLLMRDLILKWSIENGIIDSDFNTQPSVCGSLENSSNSIYSDSNSMKDLHLRIDMSGISFGSLDSSYSSDLYHPKVKDSFASVPVSRGHESQTLQFYDSIHDIKRQFLSVVSGISWEVQCRAIKDVKHYLTHYNPSCAFVSSENFLDPLVQFLKDALDKNDEEAQKDGIHLLETYLKASRGQPAKLSEEVYYVLALSLRTEAAPETLATLELLSTHLGALLDFTSSGALTSILEILDSHNKEYQAAAFRILNNLSSSINSGSLNLFLDWIPKFVPFLGDSSLTGPCLAILGNLCNFEEGRVCIAQADGIVCIIQLLETGNCNDQERAIAIILDLCAQREHYCRLVMHEGIIPSLVHVSVNGSDKGKASALELLRLLRDIKFENDENDVRSNSAVPTVILGNPERRNSPSLLSRIFRR